MGKSETSLLRKELARVVTEFKNFQKRTDRWWPNSPAGRRSLRSKTPA